MVGRLPLEQEIGVRFPVPEQKQDTRHSPGVLFLFGN